MLNLQPLCQLGYNLLALPLMRLGLQAAAPWSPKIGALLAGKKGSLARIRQAAGRLAGKRVLWLHVASAGEFLMGRPIMQQLRREDPALEFLVTFSSPSGVNWAKNDKLAAHSDYLPFDSPRNMDALLAAVQPAALILVKYDLWPNLIWRAKAHGVPVFLVSATLRAESSRRKNPWKHFFSVLYQSIDYLFAVTSADKERFRETNPKHPHLVAVGDTKMDAVLIRQEAFAAEALHPLLARIRQVKQQILVVGSSWPRDEAVIIPGWQAILKKYDDSALLVIVPHEPDEAHIAPLASHLKKENLKFQRFSDFEKSPDLGINALIVNKMGVLAGLYRIGNAAYVGSGSGGVHNVLEPVAWNLPVLFGPHYHNSPEAFELIKLGVAHAVTTPEALAGLLLEWFENPDHQATLGAKGREFLEQSKGATNICCEVIKHHLYHQPRPS